MASGALLMCGIAGVFDPRGALDLEGVSAVVAMTQQLVQRGPDDEGRWVDAPAGIALGFRRLAILDLTPAGHQPMISPSGRYVCVFNGEIYNHAELRAELLGKGASFRGTSDTEVMLAMIEAEGFGASLPRMHGMFAIALWDRRERTLAMARDRIGEKPLYYGWVGGRMVFGSTLAAMRAGPSFAANIDRSSLTTFLRYGYIPAPHSIYQQVFKLPAGTWIQFSSDRSTAAPIPYYSLRRVAERGIASPLHVSEEEAVGQLDAALRRAVGRQMVADVPLGAFLSGGIDSSTVVAVMQASSTRPVKTFSIGFNEPGFDEAPWARQVAAHLGTDHTEVYVSSEDALAVVPRLPEIYDEPFADSSQIPTVLVCQIARREVTVALSGDGGDELFGGYARYALARDFARIAGLPGRRWAVESLHRIFGALTRGGFTTSFDRRALEWLRRRTEHLRARDVDAYYATLMSPTADPEIVVPGTPERSGLLPLAPDALAGGNVTERAMLADGLQYLPDDILVKVDRAAMGVSLETRVPLLDPEVVALAWQLPFGVKVKGNRGKVVLRGVLERYVPPSLFERRKMGFGVPISRWLRGPLRPWAESLLDVRRLRSEGYLDASVVRRRWLSFLAGSDHWHPMLWNVLMWQAWREATHS